MPNSGQLAFLNDTLHLLDSFHTCPILLGGDLSIIADPKLDKSGNHHVHSTDLSTYNTRSRLLKLLDKYQLCAMWRHYHAGEHSSRHQTHSRIDFTLASVSLISNFTASSISLTAWSNNAGV